MKMHLMRALLLALVATSASAHDYKLGPLVIEHPWSRATPKGASVAGGYLKITNTGTAPDRLLGGSAEIARRFEIHEMRMDGGVMQMVGHGLHLRMRAEDDAALADGQRLLAGLLSRFGDVLEVFDLDRVDVGG